MRKLPLRSLRKLIIRLEPKEFVIAEVAEKVWAETFWQPKEFVKHERKWNDFGKDSTRHRADDFRAGPNYTKPYNGQGE